MIFLGEQFAASCEHGNEPLASIKKWGFFGQLSDFQLLRDCAAWC